MQIDLTLEEAETICELTNGLMIRSLDGLNSVLEPDWLTNLHKERIKRCSEILNKLQKIKGEEDAKIT